MIQSAYKNDFRDPKQITPLTTLLYGNKFKSDFRHGNSIIESKFRGSKIMTNTEADGSLPWKKKVVTGKKTSCHHSSTNIISCCQNHAEKFFKSIDDGKFSELPDSCYVTKVN